MILTLDRTAGTICGGGVVAQVYLDGEPIVNWCRQALVEGYELHGRTLEMWDRGCDMGANYRRDYGILCLTVQDAQRFMSPAPKPKKGRKKA